MASDRSRPIDRPRFGYTGVVGQQGRMTLDRDVNAERALEAARLDFDANAFVGPCGTPDDGYRIVVHTIAGSPPPNYNPFDVAIGRGVMYLGGQAVTLATPCTYMTQPEWPNPIAYGATDYGSPQWELFYLDVVEVEVSAVEDPDLLDVALGGPDTTGRTKLLQRIRRYGFSSKDNVTNCASAWALMVSRLVGQGFTFDPASMSLAPSATLQVSFTQTPTTTNPCDPQATGGYLGPENQLLRLRVTTVNGTARLLWGYDNASAIYQVKSTTDGKTIVLTSDPPDVFQYPAQGQWVEVLPAAAVYGAQNSGTTGAVHCVAEPAGTMHTLAQPYGPIANDDSTNYLVLDSADPLLTAWNGKPVFVRIWQNAEAITVGTGKASIELVEAATGTASASSGSTSTGVIANLAWKGTSAPAEGATWEIAVRPSTPQGVYPVEYLAAPQPAIGPKRWICPLGYVDWTVPWQAKLSDCRNPFLSLVQLTKRRAGSCMFSIDSVDVGGGVDLQQAINRALDIASAAANFTGKFTICLGPGTFALRAPLHFDARHSGMTLEGCSGRTVLTAAIASDNSNLAAFADGLIAITSAAHVTLRELEFQPTEAPVPAALLKMIGEAVGASNLNVAALGNPRMAFAVRAVNSAALTIDTCVFEFQSTRPDVNADLIGAGVFVQGACTDLDVKGCTFRSLIPATFNPLQPAQTSGAAPPWLINLTAAQLGDRATFNNQTKLDLDLTPAATRDITSSRMLVSGTTVANAEVAAVGAPAGSTPATTGASAAPASTPPPAASTLLISSAQLREQVSFAAWESVIGMKQGSGPTAPTISTIGLFAADLGVTKLKIAELNCKLGDTAFRDNLCDGVGFGALIATASYNTLRLQDNVCQGGVVGLWVAVTGAVTPDGTQGTIFFPSAEFFVEYQYAEALATTIEPPQDPSPPRVAPLVVIRKRPAPAVGSLLVTGNDIETLWSVPAGQKSSAQSSSALLLALCNSNEFITGTEVTASVTGNKLRSGSGIKAPAALVTLPPQALFAMTGNTIANAVNDGPSGDFQQAALSVEINVANGIKGVSVAGNALNGSSNLSLLKRVPTPLAPLDTLHALNADPS